MTDGIRLGDVALDLCQGRPVVVIGTFDYDAGEWSERNDYDLVSDNYGNQRLGAAPTDAVFEAVYCSSAKSEPSRSYTFPESRLLRIEHEAATDDGERLQTRLTRQVLADLFAAANAEDVDTLGGIATAAFDESLARDALELAETRSAVTGEDASH